MKYGKYRISAGLNREKNNGLPFDDYDDDDDDR